MSESVWLVRFKRPNQQQRPLVHRIEGGQRGVRTLCGKRAPAGPGRFVGQPEAVQCPTCQARQKRL